MHQKSLSFCQKFSEANDSTRNLQDTRIWLTRKSAEIAESCSHSLFFSRVLQRIKQMLSILGQAFGLRGTFYN